MELDVQRELITQVIESFKSISSPKSQIQALGDIYMVVSDGILEIQATNIELAGRTRIPLLRNEGTGAMLLPAKNLSSLIAPLRGDIVTIVYNEKKFTAQISSGKESGKISGHDPEYFPSMPVCAGTKITLPVDGFLDLAGRVIHSAAGDEVVNAPARQAIFFEFVGGTISTTATDGYRITSTFNHDLESKPDDFTMLINAKLVMGIRRVLGDIANSNQMTLVISDNRIQFTVGDLSLSVPPSDGVYPSYRAMFPSDIATRATVDTSQLWYALSYVASIDSLFVELDVLPELGVVLVSSWDDEGTENAQSEVDCIVDEAKGEAIGAEAHCQYQVGHLKAQVGAFRNKGIEQLDLLVGAEHKKLVVRPYDSETDYSLFVPNPVMTHMEKASII